MPLTNDDVKLIIPVTNLGERITYGNEYCAQCRGDLEYQPWVLTYYCSEDSFSTWENNVQIVNGTERDYLWETTEAAKYVEFDPITKIFRSTFNNRNYTCPPSVSISESLRPSARLCIPAISSCLNKSDRQMAERCRSYTSIVYDSSTLRYRNKDCAVCNGQKSKLKGCQNLNLEHGEQLN